MIVVETPPPKRGAGEGVDVPAGMPAREPGKGDCDQSLEHAGIAVAVDVRWFPDGKRARDVGGSVNVLASRNQPGTTPPCLILRSVLL